MIVYTIGQFSRIAMVSSPTLRFYHEIGLLEPHSIDDVNGYRYYSENQVRDILFISEMREYGFSLEEIKYLMNTEEKRALEEALRKKHDELLKQEQSVTYIRHKLKNKIENLKGSGDFFDANINRTETMEVKVVTTEESIKTVGISMLIPKWPPEGPDVFGDLWTKYWEEDISSRIPNKKYPSVRYGILALIDDSIYYLTTDEVTSYDDVPEDFVKYDIPNGKYAVCTFNGRNFEDLVTNSLKKANDYLNGIWLPKTNYKHAETFALEVYDERSRRADYPEMDIYQPITE